MSDILKTKASRGYLQSADKYTRTVDIRDTCRRLEQQDHSRHHHRRDPTGRQTLAAQHALAPAPPHRTDEYDDAGRHTRLQYNTSLHFVLLKHKLTHKTIASVLHRLLARNKLVPDLKNQVHYKIWGTLQERIDKR